MLSVTMFIPESCHLVLPNRNFPLWMFLVRCLCIWFPFQQERITSQFHCSSSAIAFVMRYRLLPVQDGFIALSCLVTWSVSELNLTNCLVEFSVDNGVTAAGQNLRNKLESKDAQQTKKVPPATPTFNKRHRGCSYCILDIENGPFPDFPSNEEAVGVITMEDVIEELLQVNIKQNHAPAHPWERSLTKHCVGLHICLFRHLS